MSESTSGLGIRGFPTRGRRSFLLALTLTLVPAALAGERPRSAWSVLVESEPQAATATSPELRRVLLRLSWEELLAWREGSDASQVELFDGRTLADLFGEEYSLAWRTIDGAAGVSTGAGWAVRGSLGQREARVPERHDRAAVADYVRSGRFWLEIGGGP